MDFIQDFCNFYNAISITIGETVLPEYMIAIEELIGPVFRYILELSWIRFAE